MSIVIPPLDPSSTNRISRPMARHYRIVCVGFSDGRLHLYTDSQMIDDLTTGQDSFQE